MRLLIDECRILGASYPENRDTCISGLRPGFRSRLVSVYDTTQRSQGSRRSTGRQLTDLLCTHTTTPAWVAAGHQDGGRGAVWAETQDDCACQGGAGCVQLARCSSSAAHQQGQQPQCCRRHLKAEEKRKKRYFTEACDENRFLVHSGHVTSGLITGRQEE